MPDTLDVGRGTRQAAERDGHVVSSGSYMNRVLGSFLMLPDDTFRRLSERRSLGPTAPVERFISPKCVLCGAKVDTDHVVS